MAKDPAFLFYTGDFSTGTQFFTDEQVGKFIRLLMAQHQHGRLTEQQFNFICKTSDLEVLKKFTKDENGLYYNVRLETEILKRRAFSESRSNNKKGKTKNIISKTYDYHMEDENKDKDIIDNKDKPLEINLKNFKVTNLIIKNILEMNQLHSLWAKSAKISNERMKVELKLFLEEKKTIEETYEDLQALKRHITNWFKKTKFETEIKQPTYKKFKAPTNG